MPSENFSWSAMILVRGPADVLCLEPVVAGEGRVNKEDGFGMDDGEDWTSGYRTFSEASLRLTL